MRAFGDPVVQGPTSSFHRLRNESPTVASLEMSNRTMVNQIFYHRVKPRVLVGPKVACLVFFMADGAGSVGA